MASGTQNTIRRSVCIAIAAALLGLAGAAPAQTQTNVLCLGDSITFGLGCSDDGEYPITLETLLNNSGAGTYSVTNKSRCGITVDGMLVEMKASGSPLKANPDVVTILLGTNDINGAMKSGSDPGAAVGQTLNDMQDLVDYINNFGYVDGTAPTIHVSAVVPTVDPTTSGYVRQLNTLLQSSLTGATCFSDNWDDLYNPVTGGAFSSLMNDNLHPNDAAHDLMAENFFHVIVTPEPASITLLACGALAAVVRRRRT